MKIFLPRFLGTLSFTAVIFICSAQAVAPRAEISDGGMVASRSAWASQVGAKILDQGGNAIDAAVAVGFALAVTYPSAGNLGGGGFMVIHLNDGTVITNDHREKAPAAATKDMFLDSSGEVAKQLSTRSHLAVGVPGSVAGLLSVLDKYGTMTRAQVIQPAIDLANKGILLDRDLAENFAKREKDFAPYAASRAIFSKNGKPYQIGDLWVQSDLAQTLVRIRDNGRAGFYQGRTADLIIAEMVAGNGLITHQDLKDYQPRWRQPIRGTYKGYEIVSMPPPSSGGILLVQMLNMLEDYDLGKMGFASSAAVHHMIEAQRRAYADRAQHLGDADFYPVPQQQLISKAYARKRFADFNPSQASQSENIESGNVPYESLETTHASVMDAMGNAVSYTTTLNLSYGAKMIASGTGVLLNNEMDDFSAKENTPNFYGLIGRRANAIEPGKRMLSSMTPTIVRKDGKPILVTGSPGGSTIITTTLQVILNVIEHEMSLSDAVSSPRFHHQWLPERILYETFAISPDARLALEGMGHNQLVPMPGGYALGDANSVMQAERGIAGMADPRNTGTAVGAKRLQTSSEEK
jgi:gamma-glutamyltranspeptidase/glutathione hydrolase